MKNTTTGKKGHRAFFKKTIPRFEKGGASDHSKKRFVMNLPVPEAVETFGALRKERGGQGIPHDPGEGEGGVFGGGDSVVLGGLARRHSRLLERNGGGGNLEYRKRDPKYLGTKSRRGGEKEKKS